MSKANSQMKNSNPVYTDGYEHIAAELYRLDLLIKRRVIEFRIEHSITAENSINKPLFISDTEVDELAKN